MLNELNQACRQKNFGRVLQLCQEHRMNHTGLFISTTLSRMQPNPQLTTYHSYFQSQLEQDEDVTVIETIRVMLLCNWTTPEQLRTDWERMLSDKSRLEFVTDNPDYWVILNHPGEYSFEPDRTVVFMMEPNWPVPIKTCLRTFTHDTDYNNLEWHLSKTCDELLVYHPEKTKGDTVSAVLSRKYTDPGHQLRIDFVQYLDEHAFPIDVYGQAHDYASYKGELPYKGKDKGLFPYKYTFAAENHALPNYVTEKLIDAILSETLCFYWGCPNLETILDPECFIRLDLNDKEGAMHWMQECIANQEWEKRLPILRAEKERILTELQFVPRLETFLTNLKASPVVNK